MLPKQAKPLGPDAPKAPGPRVLEDGVEFAVFSRNGESIEVCLFDEAGEQEADRWRLTGRDGDLHFGFIPGVKVGARYGLRADGPFDLGRAHRFDPNKLLIDPYATRVDRPFVWRPELAAARSSAIDTAPFVPRAIIEAAPEASPQRPPQTPGLIYEVAVRAFSKTHPDVPLASRGTLAALAHPRVIDHLVRLSVTHVELMPVAAWMTERHLARLGLENAWGYNSATFMALDPRLAPNGWDDLKAACAALHAAGVSVLIDVVFNHTAESDDEGPTVSLRGLDNAVYYRHTGDRPPRLVNDTGCGNTLASERGPVVALIVASLRAFVARAGVDGFRFDLAATLARGEGGFPDKHPLLEAIAADDLLKGRMLIAEPWDIGQGGYRLGAFPRHWMEWNDKYRDHTRRFWRGDAGVVGDFATRFAGSSDIFGATRAGPSASVNFVAAHDGFALRDVVSYAQKHNEANGEDNRDGTNDNESWNGGIEGASADPNVIVRRGRDVRALLSSLFLSLGAPMLTAGDEFGRTQQGNNNAYAQDNKTTWLDWANADAKLLAFVCGLSTLRRTLPPLQQDRFLTGSPAPGEAIDDVVWRTPSGKTPSADDWRSADTLCVCLFARAPGDEDGVQTLIVFNRRDEAIAITPPKSRPGFEWTMALDSAADFADAAGERPTDAASWVAAARGVSLWRDRRVQGRS